MCRTRRLGWQTAWFSSGGDEVKLSIGSRAEELRERLIIMLNHLKMTKDDARTKGMDVRDKEFHCECQR
jgi:hypothetical protein